MNRFRKLRLIRKLTQEEFRLQFNKTYNRSYTAAAISMFENDKRTPEIEALKDFADFFGVSIDYLLGQTNMPESEIDQTFLKIMHDKKNKGYKLGIFIKEKRQEKNLSTRDLAKLSFLSNGYISQLEADSSQKRISPTTDTLIKLAKGLGVDVNYLISLAIDDGDVISPNKAKSDILYRIPAFSAIKTSTPKIREHAVYEDAKIPFQHKEFEDLSEDEMEKLAEFAKFIKTQRIRQN